MGSNVRFGSEADIPLIPSNVRFTPEADIDLEVYSSAASIAELRPDLVAEAKRLHLSLRAIAAELAKCGHFNERGKPFSPSSVQSMVV